MAVGHSDILTRIWYGPVDEKKSTSRKAVHPFPDHSCVVALCFITELQWKFRPSGRVTGNSEVIQMLLLRPKRAASGAAGLRYGNGQRKTNQRNSSGRVAQTTDHFPSRK